MLKIKYLIGFGILTSFFISSCVVETRRPHHHDDDKEYKHDEGRGHAYGRHKKERHDD